jgi:hypothetical protein
VDFLAESPANVDGVYWLASVLGGRASIPHERALIALVGQAQKDAGPDEVINVDVILKAFGARLDRAVLVARAFLADLAKQAAQDAMRPPALMDIKLVEHLALSDAGRKVAERFGVHVADAIDPQRARHALFHVQKLPQLRTLMSPAWAIRCGGLEGSVPG